MVRKISKVSQMVCLSLRYTYMNTMLEVKMMLTMQIIYLKMVYQWVGIHMKYTQLGIL